MAARHTGDELQISKYVSVSVVYGTFARYGFTCLSLEGIDYHRAGYTFVSTEHAEKARSPFSHSRTSVPSRKSQESLSQSVKIDRKGKQGTGAHMALLWGLSVPQPLTSLTTQLSLLSVAEPQ